MLLYIKESAGKMVVSYVNRPMQYIAMFMVYID